MKQIKNGQSLFHKNMIRDDYTIPFLCDDAKRKLDKVVNLKEPSIHKGFVRSNASKMSHKPPTLSSSPYRTDIKFGDTQTSATIINQNQMNNGNNQINLDGYNRQILDSSIIHENVIKSNSNMNDQSIYTTK